jgi:hypothetical protein
MHLRYIMALVSTIAMLTAGNAWGCRTDAPPVADADLQYPPANTIAFTGMITKISTRGAVGAKPHGGFELELKIIKTFQGSNLGDTIAISYGSCHNLPGKQGEVVNVLALKDKQRGWYAPQFWRRSNDPRNFQKAACVNDTTVYGDLASDRTFTPNQQGKAYFCVKGDLIPLGYDPRKLKK